MLCMCMRTSDAPIPIPILAVSDWYRYGYRQSVLTDTFMTSY